MRAAPSSALRAGSIMGTAVVLAMTVAVAMSTGSTTPEATDDPVGGLELVAFSLPSPSDHSTVNTSATLPSRTKGCCYKIRRGASLPRDIPRAENRAPPEESEEQALARVRQGERKEAVAYMQAHWPHVRPPRRRGLRRQRRP